MKYNWKYPENKQFSPELKEIVGSGVIAQILANRGIDTPQKAELFMNPLNTQISSPYLFTDMKKSVERITQAIEKNEHIVIYGDFDADGVTSTSLLFKALKHVSADVSYYIPDRATESHGLNSKAVCTLISTRKAKLIITVDNGISNNIEISLAKNFGADVIVTDHHEAPEELPGAYSIINPKSPGALDESLDIKKIDDLQNLAGVGVAYKLAWALLESFNKEEYLEEIMYLAASGTIADVVPLVGENRGIVAKGLELVKEKKPLGLMKLLQRAGCKVENITSETIAFGVAPRINAAGRLEHAKTAVELFVEDDVAKLDMYAMQLEGYNQNRQQLCETTFMEAEHKIAEEINLNENKGIVLYDKSWHPGIIGIVASRLVEKYGMPVFLMTVNEEDNEARCSARSIEGFHLYETLNEISEVLKHYGGHSLAAGFSIDLNTIKLDDFVGVLHNAINEKMADQKFEPCIYIDADINPKELDIDFIKKLDKLAPFGASNPSPIFSVSGVELKELKLMGANKNHLKMFFADEDSTVLEAVWWNKSDLDIKLTQKANLVFSPKVNSFNGRTNLQLDMKDINNLSVSKKEEVSQPESCEGPIWLDHRKKTNIHKAVNNYLKGTDEQVAIFVEDAEVLKKVSLFSHIASRVVNRFNIKKVDQIMFFDMPADKNLLQDILDKTQSEKIHIMAYNESSVSEIDIIKKISGMLKYAHSSLDGEIKISQLASKLSVSDGLVLSAINLLEASEVIKINELAGFYCNFDFIKSAELSSIINKSEYESFREEFEKIQDFRYQLTNNEMYEIQKDFQNKMQPV